MLTADKYIELANQDRFEELSEQVDTLTDEERAILQVALKKAGENRWVQNLTYNYVTQKWITSQVFGQETNPQTKELVKQIKLSLDPKEDKCLVSSNMLKQVIQTIESLQEELTGQTNQYKEQLSLAKSRAVKLSEFKTTNKSLMESLEVAANRLEGVALAIQHHGQNINTNFFITNYSKWAEEARSPLKSLAEKEPGKS